MLDLNEAKHSVNVNRAISLNCFVFHSVLQFARCDEVFLIPSAIWSNFFFAMHVDPYLLLAI